MTGTIYSPPVRRAAVTALFVAAIGLAAVLGRTPQPDPAAAGDLGFFLTESAKEAGIDFVHEAPELDPKLDNVAPHVAGLGASVSVADFDGDGRDDLYFTQSRFGVPNALYWNRGDGTFDEVAARAGVTGGNEAGEGVSMGSVWGDVDNDGDEDLFVYRWGYPRLYENLGNGTFRDVTKRAGLRVWGNLNTAVFLDYDRDGLLDLYVGAYFRADTNLWDVDSTRIMQESWEFAENGGKNRLYHNLGNLRFEDVTDVVGGGTTRWTLAAAAADLDGDGFIDIYLANDYGMEELWRNVGGKRFARVEDAGLEDASKSGMSVALGDVLNRGRLDVYVTNITEPAYLHQGNNLRLNRLGDRGRFYQEARGVVADAGWAWGSQFGDVDNDGRVDLFVANGFISADRNRDYWYQMGKIAGATSRVFEDAASWPPLGGRSLSGYERSRLLLNRGNLRMIDVAAAAGIDDRYDGRGVAFSDLDRDGALDVIVANQKGPALLYRNRVAPGRHWVELDLVGTESNRSAIGAEVVAEFGGAIQRQVVSGGSGFCSQNSRRVHFGLGDAKRVDRLTIHWPSGRTRTLEGVAVDGVLRITESAE